MKSSNVSTIAYGADPAQFGRLYRPSSKPRGVVVVIHGGFWAAQYDLSLGDPLARDLADHGWLAWNLEYRRVGNGGGWPATFDDVSAGIDHLAQIDDVPTDKVITLGHSAGGHLAVWAAGRKGAKVPVAAAIPQAGVLDFDTAVAEDLGGGAVRRFMGGAPDDQFRLADPLRQVPLTVPIHCIHAADDDLVPINQSEAYVEAATAAGGTAELIVVDGGHFGHIDTSSRAWARTLELFDSL